MASSRDLLCEIGVEELPHELSHSTATCFMDNYLSLLSENRLNYESIKYFSTPRRFSLLIKSLSEKQKDYEEEKRGPSVEKAYKNGKPTKALLGFCSANGIKPQDAVVKNIKGNEYIFAIRTIKGRDTKDILPEILDQAINNLHFPKNMRWEESGFRFIRPIRWVMFLYGSEIIPYSKVGIESSNYSYGHRVYAKDRIIINKPDEYEKLLLNSSVIADRIKRKKIIEEEVTKLTNKYNLFVPREAEVLFDINTDLTEYPVTVLCEFEEEYLKLPPEILTSEMIEHQRYFPLCDDRNDKISNKFIVISNIKDNSLTKYGYERVLRARLNDGKFFYDEDRKRNFGEYLDKLKSVSFHPKLGSMEEKVQRIRKISGYLCSMLNIDKVTKKEIDTAALLCKNDLVTLIVNEFPNLQGIMGYYYALDSGYSEVSAKAIKEHYLPRHASDSLPEEIPGAVVGIADRLDSIIGIFSAGYESKGSKDPYGLRRNVFAIVRIILDKKLEFSLGDLIKKSIGLYPLVKEEDKFLDKLFEFFKSRIRSVFEDFGFAYDEIDATLSTVMEGVCDSYQRVKALNEMRRNKSFQDLLVAFKRIANIVKDDSGCPEGIEPKDSLLVEEAEIKLYNFYKSKKSDILDAIGSKEYEKVYSILGSFKQYVDRFFDEVLVMENDMSLRCNRIAMLREILGSFSDIIDFSKIVVA